MGATEKVTTGKKAKKEDNRSEGVLLSKLKTASLLAACKHYGVSAETDQKGGQRDELLVLRLAGHFKDKHEGELIECDVCEGLSPEDAPGGACPFCGTVDDGESREQAAVEPTTETRVSAAKDAKGHEPAAKSGEKEKETMTSAAKTANGAAKKKGTHLAVVPPAAVSKVAPVGKLATTETLDAAIAEVIRLKAQASSSTWELGARIRVIFDGQLWKQRLVEDGSAPRFKGFDPFCTHELGITPTYAYKLMDISKNFGEADVRKFGTSKLGLLLMAPAEDRPGIKDKIEKGASKREIAEVVKETRKKRGVTKRETGRKAMPAGTGRKSEKITVANVIGRKTIKMFKKPESRKADPSTWVRARRLADVPWGRMELENGVVQYFAMQESASGELQLVVETRREE